MNLVNEWIEALESGDYKQGRSVLHHVTNDTFCCLGVAAEIAVKHDLIDWHLDGHNMEYGASKCNLPSTLFDEFNLTEDRQDHLIEMNDTLHKSFDEIADQIKEWNV